mmetsp:Transcript_17779/g.20158  ORF Transcript_17779/g.20158 Transcript_17779/m.20158 type:complete len:183 (+) Transcript_17779:110-658(+)
MQGGNQGGYNNQGANQGGYNNQAGYTPQGGYNNQGGYPNQNQGYPQGGYNPNGGFNNQGQAQGMGYQGQQQYGNNQMYGNDGENMVVVMGVTAEAPGNVVYDTSYVQHHEDPVNVNCPFCKVVGVQTDVRRQPGGLTWCCALIICCLFFPLAWIPFCVKSCLDAYHYCPNCRNFLGKKPANF